MNVKLVVVGGKNAGQVIPLAGAKFLIGRAEDCHLRPNSDLVSRHHCAILTDGHHVVVRDFNSRNGTFINGERIKGQQAINQKDQLKVGTLVFEIILQAELTAPKKPKVQSLEEAAARTVQSTTEKLDDDEVDISDWVTEPVDDKKDTRAINTAQTGTVAMNTPSENIPADDDKQSEEEQPDAKSKQEEKKEKAKKSHPKSPSGIHGLKKPKAADSQAAATETLRAFFNRK